VEDDGVVERPRREVLVGASLQRQRAELQLGRVKQTLALVEAGTRGVRLPQLHREAHEEIGEHQGVRPIRGRILQRRRIVALREEEHGTTMADEIGERLVEVGVPADVTGVVQQLMDDHVGQRGAVEAQEVGEQRVGEPSQRAEGHGGADVGVVAVAFEAVRFVMRSALGEVALVGNAADNREPPRIWLQRQSLRGRHHVDDLASIDACDAGIAVTDSQMQRFLRKRAHRQHELELLAGAGVEVAALQHLLDGLAAPQNLRLLVAGAQDVPW
jgi:hypothetical protein